MKIEKGVAMPKPNYNSSRSSMYPFQEMEVGDSFAVSYADYATPIRLQSKLSSSARAWGKKHNAKFATRVIREESAVRVWRVE